MPDIIVIQIQPQAGQQNPDPRTPNDWTERQIMLIECKRPTLDTPVGRLNTIDGQFEDDCSETLNPSSFGAAAIGRKVQFFQVNANVPVGGAGRHVPLSGILDLDNNVDCATMTQRMEQVKNQGWAWAS
ncbi:hypothetical protein BDW69DRAFT_185802 [Aspergillus filifer]